MFTTKCRDSIIPAILDARRRCLPLTKPMATAQVAERGLASVAASRAARVVLCTDFDETITERDTLEMQFHLAGRHRQSPRDQEAHATVLQSLGESYTNDTKSYLTEAKQKLGSGKAQFDEQALRELVDGYAVVDQRLLQLVMDSGALGGIPNGELYELGKQAAVRNGFAAAMASVDEAHIVSANWSAEFIRGTLDNVLPTRSIPIIANDLHTDEHGLTTGAIEIRVQSSEHKAREVQTIRSASALNAQDGNLLVFVGDGINDVLAMLEADVGISLNQQPMTAMLHDIAALAGVTLKQLTEYDSLTECAAVATHAKTRGARVLFAAEDWTELSRFLRSTQ